MSRLTMPLFPDTRGYAGLRERSVPFRPGRDAQILDPIEAHDQLPTLTYNRSLSFQFGQMFGNSGPRGTNQIGQILLANRNSQEGPA